MGKAHSHLNGCRVRCCDVVEGTAGIFQNTFKDRIPRPVNPSIVQLLFHLESLNKGTSL